MPPLKLFEVTMLKYPSENSSSSERSMDLTNPLPSEFTRLLAQEKDVSLFLDAKEKNETSHLKIVLRTLALAGPMTASYTFSFSLVAIAVMMGRIGSQEDLDEYLAATPLITTGMQSFAFLMASSVLGTSLEAGKRFGELQRLETDEPDNNHDISEQLRSIREVFRASMGLSTLITPLGMLGMYHTEELLNLIHINPEVTALVGQFLRIYSFALPGFMLRISSEQMLFAYGKTVPAMVIGLISFAVNTALAAWLAFGSPQLGIPGIALGYLAEAYLTAFGFSAYIAFQKKFRPLELFKLSHLSTSIFKTLKTLLGLGLPITLQFAAEIAIDQLSLMFAGWLGTTALAAQAC